MISIFDKKVTKNNSTKFISGLRGIDSSWVKSDKVPFEVNYKKKEKDISKKRLKQLLQKRDVD